MRERALTEAERERITKLVHNGIERLDFAADLSEGVDDSAPAVCTIWRFTDQIHGGAG